MAGVPEGLLESLRDDSAIARHLPKIADAVAALPAAVADAYSGWVDDPATYRYASEAFYQHRILRWIANAAEADLASPDLPAFLARQLVRPSSFADSPRVKRVPPCAFVIYPQAAIYWLYEFATILSRSIQGLSTHAKTIAEFIYRVIARRSFVDSASPATEFGIDFLIDTIVLGKRQGGRTHELTDHSAALVQGVEDFIINHELAHVFNAHSTSTATTEAEADQTAIRLMLRSTATTPLLAGEQVVDVRTWPFDAYVMLQAWGLIRSAAEHCARTHLSTSEADLEAASVAYEREHAARLDRLAALGSLLQFPAPLSTRTLIDATSGLVAQIAATELDRAEVERIARLSKSLAERDYSTMSGDVTDAAQD